MQKVECEFDFLIKNFFKRSIQELRKICADCMRKNREEFAPFLIDPNSGEMLNEDEFEAYCRKVEKTTNWGGQPEVQYLKYFYPLIKANHF